MFGKELIFFTLQITLLELFVKLLKTDETHGFYPFY